MRFKGKVLPGVVWQQCVDRLQDELPSQQFNTWIRPLQATTDGQSLTLFAPNRFIKDFVSDKFAQRIHELVAELEPGGALDVVLEIGGSSVARLLTRPAAPDAPSTRAPVVDDMPPAVSGAAVSSRPAPVTISRPPTSNPQAG